MPLVENLPQPFFSGGKLSHVDILGSEGTKCPQDAWVNAMVRADPDPDKASWATQGP